ncbi:MAG: creatininase family protein, partial [Nitratireductor sp.]
MMISEMNWMDVERRVARDTRCILPIGSTEQHAQLSLCVDMILAERVAREAAEPLG